MRQGVAANAITVTAQAHLRYAGTDSAIPIPVASLAGMRALFEIAHQKRFGFTSPGKDIEIEAVEVTATGGGEHAKEAELKLSDAPPERRDAERILHAWRLARGARHSPREASSRA